MTARKPLAGRPAVTAIALEHGLDAYALQSREVAERGAVEDVRAMAREARR